jgi:hypothetical protein
MKLHFVVQMWRFLGARRKYWLLPIIIAAMLGGLLDRVHAPFSGLVAAVCDSINLLNSRIGISPAHRWAGLKRLVVRRPSTTAPRTSVIW